MRLLLILVSFLLQIPAQAQLQYRVKKTDHYQIYAAPSHPHIPTYYYYSGSNPTGRHDSTVSFPYPNKRITECLYDANGNVVADYTSIVLTIAPPAPPSLVSENSYSYTNGMLDEVIHYDSKHAITGKDLYSYANNKLTQHTVLTGQPLVNSTQLKYAYDAAGKLTGQLYEKWDAANNNWKARNLKKFVYDSNNLLIQDKLINLDMLSYDYDTVTSFYHYNTSQQLDTVRSMIWDTASKNYIVQNLVINEYDNAIHQLSKTYTRSIVHYPYLSSIDEMTYLYETYWPSIVSQSGESGVAVTLYPVPAKDIICFSIKGKQIQAYEIGIYNVAGSRVANWNELAKKDLTKQLLLDNIPAGSYILSVKSKDGVVNKPFVIEK